MLSVFFCHDFGHKQAECKSKLYGDYAPEIAEGQNNSEHDNDDDNQNIESKHDSEEENELLLVTP